MSLQSSLGDKILKSNYQPVLPVMGNNFTKWSDHKTKFPNCPVSNEDNTLVKTKPKYKISRAGEKKARKTEQTYFYCIKDSPLGVEKRNSPDLNRP